MKIGVFDSGVGGLSVALALENVLVEHEIVFKEDSENLPYGNKTPEILFDLVLPVLEGLVDEGCEVIVIACNTVSTTLAPRLREVLTVPIVAIEPMVKPAAALTKAGKIIVCATPTTLASKRYKWLKDTFTSCIEVIEPDCSDWAGLIEGNKINSRQIEKAIRPGLENGADVVVLGCTHYHWIQSEVQKMAAGRAEVIQPESGIVQRVRAVINEISSGKTK